MSSSVPAAGRLSLYANLLRLDKPVGTLLLLWPTLTALWIASSGRPALGLLAVFVIGTFLMRSAGCAINDAADFRYDAQVKRTAHRVVAQGLISPREAVAVSTLLAGLSALLLLFLNDEAMRLAVAAVAIAATYPLFKRFFPVPQVYLGVAFSFGIPMAFAAVQGDVPAIGWWLFFANNFWVVAYDTEYAMVDRDDDLRVGIKSSAIFFGRADVAVTMACYGAYLSLLLLLGNAIRAGWPFYLGCGIAFGFALYHYMLIRERTREGCFQAFRHNNWVGFAVFAGTALDYALR
ncbi:MAG: 4-hydroxybenzoate octaprenyltransferase [Burkholderiaceae bacterium]